ncbi:hypothetical protein EV426DRAFT_680900 [Tirmania nivea]|nr:hypothetical protein EV426DRAFT_680900 [Tirmania nivea]
MNTFNLNQRLSSENITSDVSNCLLLREDIHCVFDEAIFVISPKNGKYVSHFLQPTTNLGRLYHNCEAWELGVRAEFLHARFAWAIFQLHGAFVAKHKPTSVQSLPGGNDSGGSENGSSGRGRGHGRDRGRSRGRARGRRGHGVVRSGAIVKGHAAPQRSNERLKSKGKGKPNISQMAVWKGAYPGLGSEISCTEDPAWNTASWYPGVEEYEEMRECALEEREPELHKRECARVEKLLREGGVIWDDDDR